MNDFKTQAEIWKYLLESEDTRICRKALKKQKK